MIRASILALAISVSPIFLFGQSTLDKLKALKENVGNLVPNLIEDGNVSEAIKIRIVSYGKSLGSEICSAISGANEVLLCAKFLSDAEVVKSLALAARKGATICVILENKVSISDYPVPDYLVKSSIPVFFPDRRISLGNDFVLIDGKSAYILPDWSFSASRRAFGIALSGDCGAVYGAFLDILQVSEASEATRLYLPDEARQAMERLR